MTEVDPTWCYVILAFFLLVDLQSRSAKNSFCHAVIGLLFLEEFKLPYDVIYFYLDNILLHICNIYATL